MKLIAPILITSMFIYLTNFAFGMEFMETNGVINDITHGQVSFMIYYVTISFFVLCQSFLVFKILKKNNLLYSALFFLLVLGINYIVIYHITNTSNLGSINSIYSEETKIMTHHIFEGLNIYTYLGVTTYGKILLANLFLMITLLIIKFKRNR